MTVNRRISLEILEEVLNEKAYSNLAISSMLNRHKEVDKRERAFITELTNGTLRNLIYVDYIIGQFSSVKKEKLNPVILNILRQAVYQVMFMSTAPYAICNEAVEMAKSRGLKGLGSFVNGVLRNIIRNKDKIRLPDKNTDSAKYISIRYSIPEWIAEKWLSYYGYGFTEQMCEKNNETPAVTVRINTLKTDGKALQLVFEKENVLASPMLYGTNAFVLKSSGGLGSLPSHKNGLYHVQDLSSQLAVEILNPHKGASVLDLCAAPGGKSFTCAYLMENLGKIYARDIYTHKIKLINEGARRLGINIIETKKQSAETADHVLLGMMDYVVVDAPCSGLGLIRKKPDIKLNKTKESISELQKLQRSILRAGAGYVKRGGVLMYSTCTITDEENIDNVNWFLENFDFRKDDFTELVHESLKPHITDGCLRLFPHIHNTDGFFISKFVRG